jgi:integrase
MSLIAEFKLIPQHRAAIVFLAERVIRALAVPGPYTEEQCVEWAALERAGDRIVTATRFDRHLIAAHAPDFWPAWKRFVDRNILIDKSPRRHGVPDCPPAPAPAPAATAIRPESTELAADVRVQLGLSDAPIQMLPSINKLLKKPLIDNGSTIRLVRSEWGTDRLHVEYEGEDESLPSVAPLAAPLACAPSHATPQAAAADGVVHCETLSEAIKGRLDGLARKLGDRRGDESHGRVLQFASDFLGDRPLTSIKALNLRELETALTEIPDRKGIPKPQTKSLFLRYRYAKDNGTAGLIFVGETTLIGTYYGCMNSFLQWVRTKTDWTPPPFIFNAESNEARPPEQRDAFQDEELLRFFSLPLFTGCASATHFWTAGSTFVQNALYWGYIIHIFMGLRPSEIGKLRPEDLVQEGNLWFIDMRDKKGGAEGEAKKAGAKRSRRLKTESAHRRVPVPRLLIDLGLADLAAEMKKRGEERLFPHWTIYRHPQSGREMHGHYLSKSWQYVKVAHKFERERLTLYSGRHTLAGWYDAMNLPQRVRDRLLGHAPQTVPGQYGPIDLTMNEARLALGTELQIQMDIADRLLTAKLQAQLGMLTPIDSAG